MRVSRLVAKEFRLRSEIDGFTNFSVTPPLEWVETDDIDGGNSFMGPDCMVWTTGTPEQFRDRDDAPEHQQSVLSRSMRRREIR